MNEALPAMTDGDWIRATNSMKAFAEGETKKPLGDFDRHYATALRHIAVAYQHADGTNQLAMRHLFETVIAKFHQPAMPMDAILKVQQILAEEYGYTVTEHDASRIIQVVQKL